MYTAAWMPSDWMQPDRTHRSDCTLFDLSGERSDVRVAAAVCDLHAASAV
jgi:hypothetical protein